MKMNKILAAVMAGTMVFAVAAPVFAATPTRVTPPYDCWWAGPVDLDGDGTAEYTLTDDEYASKFFDLDDITGDGTWTVAMKCVETDLGADQGYTVTGDVWGDNEKYLSYGTHGDIWGDSGTFSGQNTSVAPELAAGDIVTFEITREGQNFNVNIAKNGTDFLRLAAADAAPEGDTLHTRVCVQYGPFDVYPLVAGDKDAAIAAVNGGDSDSASDTSDDTDDADDASSGDSTSNDASTGDSTASDTTAASGTTSSTTTATTKTGDEGPIVAVVVALVGCAAIAFASKKRFVK